MGVLAGMICPKPDCGGGTFTNEDGLQQCWLCGRVVDAPEPSREPEARGARRGHVLRSREFSGKRGKVGVINGQETRRR